MPTYYLAPALSRLRNEVNARWPGRDKASDGWVGDTAHAARKSDHNPDYSAGGVVRAVDLDKDGMDAGWLIACAIQDHRTNYIIHRGLIYQRIYGFKPRPYTGANAHNLHTHVSLRHGKAWEDDTSSWLDNAVPVSRPLPGRAPAAIPTPSQSILDALTPVEEPVTIRILRHPDERLAASGPGPEDFVILGSMDEANALLARRLITDQDLVPEREGGRLIELPNAQIWDLAVQASRRGYDLDRDR